MKASLRNIGLILLVLGVVLPLVGVAVPSPLGYVSTGADGYVWFPFVNYVTLAAVALIVYVAVTEKQRRSK